MGLDWLLLGYIVLGRLDWAYAVEITLGLQLGFASHESHLGWLYWLASVAQQGTRPSSCQASYSSLPMAPSRENGGGGDFASSGGGRWHWVERQAPPNYGQPILGTHTGWGGLGKAWRRRRKVGIDQWHDEILMMLWPNWRGLEHQHANGSSGIVLLGLRGHQGGLAPLAVGGTVVEHGGGRLAVGMRWLVAEDGFMVVRRSSWWG